MSRSVLVLAVLFALVTSASAQNVRSAVSLAGSDLATCTVPDPCRTFGVAISRTNLGGEVIVLSSGGYGPFTITQSVSVVSPLGIHAAIAPTAGDAITVDAPDSTVIVRGLYLNSQGAGTGIRVGAADVVHLENLVVNGFVGNGIDVLGPSEVFVKDSEVRNCGASGLFAGPGSGLVILTVDRVRLQRNQWGFAADSGVRATLRETVAVRNLQENFLFRNGGALNTLRATVENSIAADSAANRGFAVLDGSQVTIRSSAAVRNNTSGFAATSQTAGVTSLLYLDQCLAAENAQGMQAGVFGMGSGVISVSNSSAVRNFVGMLAGSGGTIRAVGNTVTDNQQVGIANQGGIFQSAGHNAVLGNSVDADGVITPVPTM